MQSEDSIPPSLKRNNTGRLAFPTLLAITTIAFNYHSVEAQLIKKLSIGEKIAEELTYNSQTMPLLKPGAQVSADPITLASGAFVAETGPLGVSYDTIPGGVISQYVVQSGDSLEEIAKTFGISKNTIVWANNLKKDAKLTVGQQLVILPISGVRYVTKQSGERVVNIAKQFGADIDDIVSYNDLESQVLAKGVEIIIPDGEIVIEKKEEKAVAGTSTKKSQPTATTGAKKLATRVSVSALKDPNGYYTVPLKTGTRTQKLHGFNGIDIGVPVGTPVYAAAAGTVISVKNGAWNGGYGNYVVISHSNGSQTLYAHNSKNLVSVGEKVSQGDQIALSGNTGKSTGPHLHFEVRNAKQPFAN